MIALTYWEAIYSTILVLGAAGVVAGILILALDFYGRIALAALAATTAAVTGIAAVVWWAS